MTSPEQFQALFDPEGVAVVGVSHHPGKFGFAVIHHILLHGYDGAVFAVGRDARDILGVPMVTDVADLPDGGFDLLFICSPPDSIPDLLRTAAGKGARAAFVATAGFSEAGEEGRRAELHLAELADELGLLLAGPNGIGVISTPAQLCAQLQATYPPRGRISVVSQSGNFVMAMTNYAIASGIGLSRAVSVGNAAALGVDDYVRYLMTDAETGVIVVYLEGVRDGRRLFEALSAASAVKPVVALKGGSSSQGARAARSHTGALAGDEKIFAGMCRQAGVVLVPSAEQAYEVAATLSCQPLPHGPRTAVVTLAGGWGVLAADAISRTALELVALPEAVREAIDQRLPPRWSRQNPIDLAGGEGRNTVLEVLEIVTGHDAVDAVVFIGLGIQANTAKFIRASPHFPGHGLDRIAAYHQGQDVRYAVAAAEISDRFDKPVFSVTELAATDPTNAAVTSVRSTGRLCYPSVDRAVAALDHAWRYRRHHDRRTTSTPEAQTKPTSALR